MDATPPTGHLSAYMPLNREQLNAVAARAFPGEQVRDARPLPGDRYALLLTSGERLHLHIYPSSHAAAGAIAALRMLRGEIDLPLPLLRAADAEGETIGRPYALTSALEGEPLSQVLQRIPGEQLYNLGRRLGELINRVHRLAVTGYGVLATPPDQRASDERTYVLARIDEDLAQCRQLGLLHTTTDAELRLWFAGSFQPVSRQAALLHGGLSPETLLVRQAQGGWRLSGLLGWGHAMGWSPAWEHSVFLDATNEGRYFGLRVGYGNGYDEQTKRAYEQVREHMLAPYRALLALRRTNEAHLRGDHQACERYRNSLIHTLRWLNNQNVSDDV